MKPMLSLADIPLKKKLILFLVLFVILPLVGVGVYFNYYFVNSTLEKAYEGHLLTIRQAEQSLVPLFLELEHTSNKVITNDDVQMLLSTANVSENSIFLSRKNDLLHWITQEKTYYSFIDSIHISEKGQLFIGVGKTQFQPSASLADFSQSVESFQWGSVEKQQTSYGEGYVLHYLQKLRCLNNPSQDIGVLSLLVPELLIRKTYAVAYLQPDSQTFLINEDNTVISSNLEPYIGKAFPFPQDTGVVRSKSTGYFDCTIGNKPHVAFYFAVSKSPWILVQYLPKEVFTSGQGTINLVILTAISLCALFGILFSIQLNRVVLKPIQRLLVEMQKLPQGIFDVDFTDVCKDEIGLIQTAYATTVMDLKRMIDSVYISDIKKREAEFLALEAQINPHFLYNSLDSIHWLSIKNKDYEVSEQIEALSDMFKHVLRRGKEMVTILEEIEYVKNYMYLQQSRYGRRIRLNISVTEKLWQYTIPKLIIQPLVENAILHGLESKVGGGHVDVSVYEDAQYLRICVEDDGVGTSAAPLMAMIQGNQQTERVSALKNIHSRLQLKYGEEYGLIFRSGDGKTTAALCLPLFPGEDVPT